VGCDRPRRYRVKELVCQLLHDDGGQDLVEYALLVGFVAALGVAGFPLIIESMRDTFLHWNGKVNDLATPPAPQ
jgi:Flp pilus assembly pilin Flp